MANQQESSRLTRWSYQNTIYSNAISQLNYFENNSDSEYVICPKDNCQVKLYNRKQLYRHIENYHCEDKLHGTSYSKYNLFNAYLFFSNKNTIFSTTTSSTATENPDTNDYEMENEESSSHVEFNLTDASTSYDLDLSSSIVHDFQEDEYLKVKVQFV